MLLFSNLALSTSSIVFVKRPVNVDADYIRAASQLFIHSTELCLEKLTDSTTTTKPSTFVVCDVVPLCITLLFVGWFDVNVNI